MAETKTNNLGEMMEAFGLFLREYAKNNQAEAPQPEQKAVNPEPKKETKQKKVKATDQGERIKLMSITKDKEPSQTEIVLGLIQNKNKLDDKAGLNDVSDEALDKLYLDLLDVSHMLKQEQDKERKKLFLNQTILLLNVFRSYLTEGNLKYLNETYGLKSYMKINQRSLNELNQYRFKLDNIKEAK